MEYSVHSGSETLALSPRNAEKLKLMVDEHIDAPLLVTHNGTWESLQVEVIVSPYSSLTLMLKNDGNEDVVLQVGGNVHRDASLTLALYELNASNTRARVTLDLYEEGASVVLHDACIAASRKQFHMQCNHLQAHTKGLMENYAVVEEDGQHRMETTRKVTKSARENNSHQKTKMLTMSERHSSEMVPVLLIDENNVKTSHATTLGQPDENRLYYLQTRGLSRRQALGLLIAGHIMPIAELFDQEEVRATLEDEVEMKVGLRA